MYHHQVSSFLKQNEKYMPIQRTWKKNLYENQGFNDNYTSPSFLKQLERNKNIKIYTLIEALNGSTLLSNQLSCITVFLLIFYLLYNEIISPTCILTVNSVILLIFYSIYYTITNNNLDSFIDDCKTLLTVLFFGYIFSPLLHKLTDAISTDTIFSMTFFVFILNIVFYDYGLDVAIVSKSISINASIFGSICLASRLSSSYHAFVLLITSVLYFVLYPVLVKYYWKSIYLLPISLLCLLILYKISIPVFLTYLIAILFINLVYPIIFASVQRYKNNIYGPWDEAIIQS